MDRRTGLPTKRSTGPGRLTIATAMDCRVVYRETLRTFREILGGSLAGWPSATCSGQDISLILVAIRFSRHAPLQQRRSA